MQKNIKILNDNPVVSHYLSLLRNKNTDTLNFKYALNILSDFLAMSATKNLPIKEVEIETPIQKTKSKIIDTDKDIFIVPILRAGLGLCDSLSKFLPFAKIQHLGMYRDEKTLQPVWYYNKLPKAFKDAKNTFVYICDPMLATGGSIIEAIKLYKEKNILEENITLVNLICSPEGIENVLKLFPKVNIFTISVDEKLNEKGYIVPGLGDAGDRIFNTIY